MSHPRPSLVPRKCIKASAFNQERCCRILLEGVLGLRKVKNKFAGLVLVLLVSHGLFGWPQDLAGGASTLVGQDIIGGAAVTFKRPPRVRDLSGGASLLLVKRRPPRRPTESTQIARNKPSPQPGA